MCVCVCVQTKGALAAAAAASAVAAQVARGRGRAALARGAFVSAAAPGYVTPGSERRFFARGGGLGAIIVSFKGKFINYYFCLEFVFFFYI